MSALSDFANFAKKNLAGPSSSAPGDEDDSEGGGVCTAAPPADDSSQSGDGGYTPAQPSDDSGGSCQPDIPDTPTPLLPAGNPPADTQGTGDGGVSGQITLPETTVSVSSEQQDAYNTGFQDGKSGAPSNPVDRVGLDLASEYEAGYQDGQAAAAKATSSPTEADQEESKEAYACGFNDGQAEQRVGKCLEATTQDRFKYQAAGLGSFFESGFADGSKSQVSPQQGPTEGTPDNGPVAGPYEESEEPEKPDEVPNWAAGEWSKYVRLRDRIRQWRMYKSLGDEEDASRYELSEQERVEYEQLYSKLSCYDSDSEYPPTAEEGEVEGEEGEAQAE